MPADARRPVPPAGPLRTPSSRRRLAVLALALLLLGGACINAGEGTGVTATPTDQQVTGLNANSPVTLKSVGPVVVGMSIDQLTAAAGVAMTRQPDFDQAVAETGCAYLSPATIPGYVPPADSGNKSPLAFMIVDGQLARIDILGGNFSTPQGIKVGSAETEVLAAYGNGSSPLPPRAFIGPPYRYLTATPREEADQQFRMVFESDGAKVVQYRVGMLPYVENKQGCLP